MAYHLLENQAHKQLFWTKLSFWYTIIMQNLTSLFGAVNGRRGLDRA
jgi:hypothetical protein